MAYTALYRKFRPPIFDDVKGQDHIVTTLKNQILSDRVGHAYLFCGTRGTGKTSVAKILSRAVNCENPVGGNPCGECETCRAIAEGRCVDVVEMDAASNNGVENIRTVIDEISYSPSVARKKVYIIDEVHMLSTGAFNALLKTLEEPPEYVLFILATTEVQKIPITILSRCQRYDFHRITMDTIKDRLAEVTRAENVNAEDKALSFIARAADGSMRDSLSLLDQCIAFHYGEELTYERVLDVLGAVDTQVFGSLFDALYRSDASAAISILADVVLQGGELTQFVNDFVWYLRNMMLVSASDEMEDAVDISRDNLKLLKQQAQDADIDTIMRYIRIFSELSASIRLAAQKRILIEMAIIRLCKPESDGDDTEALTDRIRILESHDREIRNQVARIEKEGVAIAPSAAAGQAVIARKEPPRLDRAVPEDIQKIVAEFHSITQKLKDPMLKSMFVKNRPRLSLGADDSLLVVFQSGDVTSSIKVIMDHKEALMEELGNITGKQVPVDFKVLGNGEAFEDYYVDLESLQDKGLINAEIVMEEEEAYPVNDSKEDTALHNAAVAEDAPTQPDDTKDVPDEDLSGLKGYDMADEEAPSTNEEDDIIGYSESDEEEPDQEAVLLAEEMAREEMEDQEED